MQVMVAPLGRWAGWYDLQGLTEAPGSLEGTRSTDDAVPAAQVAAMPESAVG
jgi:hypothetical protein